MVKTKKIIFGILFISFISCGGNDNNGTDTGNPTTTSLQFIGQTTGVTLSEARIVVKEIDFDPIDLCQTESESPEEESEESALPGPFVIDLLNNTSVPATNSFQILSGLYCEMDMSFDRLEENNIPDGIELDDPIIGNALILQGESQDGVPFELQMSEADKFKLTANSDTGFAIEESDAVTLLFIAFDMDTWFTGVNLDETTLVDGVILMNDNNNTNLRTIVVENIKQSARLYHDRNGNNVLDDDETTEGLILANGEDEEED